MKVLSVLNSPFIRIRTIAPFDSPLHFKAKIEKSCKIFKSHQKVQNSACISTHLESRLESKEKNSDRYLMHESRAYR